MEKFWKDVFASANGGPNPPFTVSGEFVRQIYGIVNKSDKPGML